MMPPLTDVRTDQPEQHAFLLVLPIRPYDRGRGVMTGLRREAGLRRVSTPS
jgi:hypothetical protein